MNLVKLDRFVHEHLLSILTPFAEHVKDLEKEVRCDAADKGENDTKLIHIGSGTTFNRTVQVSIYLLLQLQTVAELIPPVSDIDWSGALLPEGLLGASCGSEPMHRISKSSGKHQPSIESGAEGGPKPAGQDGHFLSKVCFFLVEGCELP